MNNLKFIRKTLKAKASIAGRLSFQKFIPTSQNVYGVRVPVLNQLAKECRAGGFPLVEALWRSGAYEERLLAVKILGANAKKDPDRALKTLIRFSRQISDWAVCDTLGMQGMRSIARSHEPEIIAIARIFLKSPRMWTRRLGLVLFTHYAKDKHLRPSIRRWIQPLEKENEHYIKRAIVWLHKDLNK